MSLIPPTRMSKKELQDALLKSGFTEARLRDENGKKLKREALMETYLGTKPPDDTISVQQPDDKVEGSVSVANVLWSEKDKESLPPGPSDPEWTQYVLGKFLPDEVDGQNPRVEGLRRVSSELVGELVEEGCDLVSAPCEANGYRACVKAWAIFLTNGGKEKRFEALADAHPDNCIDDYVTYLVAMADTRAKGRVFRNALMLRRVVAAEEVSKTLAMAADIQSGGAIHVGQISMIRILTDRMGISVAKLLESMGIQYDISEKSGEVNLKTLPYEDALEVTKRLHKIRQDGETPEELKAI